jgi:hypothetical protein
MYNINQAVDKGYADEKKQASVIDWRHAGTVSIVGHLCSGLNIGR